VLPTPYRQLLTAGLLAAALGGCEATGDTGGLRTISDASLPFEFRIPTTFTEETIDRANSRGNLVVAAGLTKVDVVAVREIAAADVPARPTRHVVLGKDVTSEVHAVDGVPGYAFECQYTSARADDVRAACRDAMRTVTRK
jgi:hypothetical protein